MEIHRDISDGSTKKLEISPSSFEHLSHAINHYSAFTVEALLEGEYLDPHKKDEATGNNALHLCVKEGKLDLLKCFVKAGTNFGDTNGDGETPLELALAASNQEIVDYLLQLQNGTGDALDNAAGGSDNAWSPTYNVPIWLELIHDPYPKAGYIRNAFMTSPENDYRVTAEFTVLPRAKRFSIDIMNRKDLLFHFNPRISSKESHIVMNSIEDGGNWGQEEIIRQSPIQRGRRCRVEIYFSSHSNKFIVSINDREEDVYLSRIKPVNLERAISLPWSDKDDVSYNFIKMEEIKLSS